jgi:hypothetical protein
MDDAQQIREWSLYKGRFARAPHFHSIHSAANRPTYAGTPYRNLFCSRITQQHLSIYITSIYIFSIFLTIYPCFAFKKYTALLHFHFDHCSYVKKMNYCPYGNSIISYEYIVIMQVVQVQHTPHVKRKPTDNYFLKQAHLILVHSFNEVCTNAELVTVCIMTIQKPITNHLCANEGLARFPTPFMRYTENSNVSLFSVLEHVQ